MTPAAENIRGTSALPFHLLVHRPEDVNVDIYTFNFNSLSQEKIDESANRLRANIKILPYSPWLRRAIRSPFGMPVRLFLRYPIHYYLTVSTTDVATINSAGYDAIWIYGEEMGRVSRQFAQYRRAHILPDCTSLFYHRMLAQRFVFGHTPTLLKCMLFYKKYVDMERQFDTADNISYFLVGKADAESLRDISPGIKAHFLHHPHYDVAANADRQHMADSDSRRIRLLVAGQNNYYMAQNATSMVDSLCSRPDLAENYEITFLGHGWENHVIRLSSHGYSTRHITFAPDYIQEISRHDIQLTPISIGTGTKGKVLDAMANGLLVMGTPYAMENIEAVSGESCITYKTSAEMLNWLDRLAADRSIINSIAEAGRRAVLNSHSRTAIAKEFFGTFSTSCDTNINTNPQI